MVTVVALVGCGSVDDGGCDDDGDNDYENSCGVVSHKDGCSGDTLGCDFLVGRSCDGVGGRFAIMLVVCCFTGGSNEVSIGKETCGSHGNVVVVMIVEMIVMVVMMMTTVVQIHEGVLVIVVNMMVKEAVLLYSFIYNSI